MSEINVFAGPLLQSTQVQHQQSADKSRQIRRQQSLGKNVAPPADEYEHSVESAEAVAPIHEQDSKEHPQKRRTKHPHTPRQKTGQDDNPPARLDLTA